MTDCGMMWCTTFNINVVEMAIVAVAVVAVVEIEIATVQQHE